MAVLYVNNASTVLDGGINDSVTSMTVIDASVFPAIGGADYCYLTLIDTSSLEIVKATAVAGNVITIERGADNTTAAALLQTQHVS